MRDERKVYLADEGDPIEHPPRGPHHDQSPHRGAGEGRPHACRRERSLNHRPSTPSELSFGWRDDGPPPPVARPLAIEARSDAG